MRLQRASYTCGIYAVMNALRVFGDRVTEKKVRTHTGTTKAAGTTEHGIKNALERLDYVWVELKPTNKDDAWAQVCQALEDGFPVIISSDEDDHWMTVIGSVGERLVVFDPDRAWSNSAENGVHVWDQKQLFRRWNRSSDHYYGIRVETQ